LFIDGKTPVKMAASSDVKRVFEKYKPDPRIVRSKTNHSIALLYVHFGFCLIFLLLDLTSTGAEAEGDLRSQT
jgi:hypothetical protein